jgi:hypothetical protein
MAAVNSVKTVDYSKNDKQILVAPELAFTIGCLVTNTGLSADENGKKILKAGTPVGGGDVLTNRQTVLEQNTSAPVGVVLHDVDVTEGQENATLVVKGIVDIEKLDSDVITLVNAAKENLSEITFMSGSKN